MDKLEGGGSRRKGQEKCIERGCKKVRDGQNMQKIIRSLEG